MRLRYALSYLNLVVAGCMLVASYLDWQARAYGFMAATLAVMLWNLLAGLLGLRYE